MSHPVLLRNRLCERDTAAKSNTFTSHLFEHVQSFWAGIIFLSMYHLFEHVWIWICPIIAAIVRVELLSWHKCVSTGNRRSRLATKNGRTASEAVEAVARTYLARWWAPDVNPDVFLLTCHWHKMLQGCIITSHLFSYALWTSSSLLFHHLHSVMWPPAHACL